jgi:hypothetical protein
MKLDYKKVAILSTVSSALLGVAQFAGATYITLPETAVADLTGYAGAIFTDIWTVVALVIGIPLAFYVIRKVIALVRMH